MKIEIDSKKNNPLLNRTEVYFTIHHEGEGTPNREITRSELAEKLNVKKENIVVDNIHSSFGIQESKGYAKVYTSVEKAKDWDREHILVRNKLIVKEEKKPEEKPVEKPKEKPETAEEPEKEEKKLKRRKNHQLRSPHRKKKNQRPKKHLKRNQLNSLKKKQNQVVSLRNRLKNLSLMRRRRNEQKRIIQS